MMVSNREQTPGHMLRCSRLYIAILMFYIKTRNGAPLWAGCRDKTLISDNLGMRISAGVQLLQSRLIGHSEVPVGVTVCGCYRDQYSFIYWNIGLNNTLGIHGSIKLIKDLKTLRAGLSSGTNHFNHRWTGEFRSCSGPVTRASRQHHYLCFAGTITNDSPWSLFLTKTQHLLLCLWPSYQQRPLRRHNGRETPPRL